jgi:beta-galactosidase
VLELMGQHASQEYLPDFLIDDRQMVIEGRDVESAIDHWPNLCHPKVQDAIRRYFEAVVPHYRGHPALYGWDVFNETHFRSYDSFTEREFQGWLGRKYGDAESLNRSWGRRYRRFEEVRLANLLFSASVWASLQPVLDLNRFFAEITASLCERWAAWVRALDPRHVLIVDNAHSLTLKDPSERCDDDWLTARSADHLGLSLYPKSWGHSYTPAMVFQSVDAMRSAAAWSGKPLVVSELQTHYQSALTPGSEVSPEELVSWSWAALACGVEALTYWRWRPFRRGYQITGRGLTRIDGSSSPREEAVQEIAARLKEWGQDFRRSRVPPARIALLYSWESAVLSRCLKPSARDLYERNLHGWYRALWERDQPAAMLRAEMLRIPSEVELLILPCCLVVTEALAEDLRRFAERGGRLIADARLGICDDANRAYVAIPGPRLGSVFGVEELDLHEDESGFIRQRLALSSGARERGGVIQYDNACYVPTCAGLAYLAGHDQRLADALEASGIPRTVCERVTRERESDQCRYRFIFDAATGSLLHLERQRRSGS